MSGRKRSLKGGRAAVTSSVKIENDRPYEVSSLPMKALRSSASALSVPNIKSRTAMNIKKDPIDEALKPYIPEILKYYEVVSKKPASPDCIKALENFRLASKTMSFDEVSQKAYILMESYFLPQSENDIIEQYYNGDSDTNTFKNAMMAKYLHSVVNYASAEEFLYAGSGYVSKKNKY